MIGTGIYIGRSIGGALSDYEFRGRGLNSSSELR